MGRVRGHVQALKEVAMYKTHDLGGFKAFLGVVGVAFIVVAIVMAIWVPSEKAWEQVSINTYYHQAMQAATPAQLATALVKLDQALESAGMVSGPTQVPWMARGQDQDMAFKRGRIQSLVLVAEQLASHGIASVEVNTGLATLRDTLEMMRVSTYGFWVWSQGGVGMAIYVPLFCLMLGVIGIIAAIALPDYITRRSRAQPNPSS